MFYDIGLCCLARDRRHICTRVWTSSIPFIRKFSTLSSEGCFCCTSSVEKYAPSSLNYKCLSCCLLFSSLHSNSMYNRLYAGCLAAFFIRHCQTIFYLGWALLISHDSRANALLAALTSDRCWLYPVVSVHQIWIIHALSSSIYKGHRLSKGQVQSPEIQMARIGVGWLAVHIASLWQWSETEVLEVSSTSV